jgi:hypothetical protein
VQGVLPLLLPSSPASIPPLLEPELELPESVPLAPELFEHAVSTTIAEPTIEIPARAERKATETRIRHTLG